MIIVSYFDQMNAFVALFKNDLHLMHLDKNVGFIFLNLVLL